MNHCNGTHIQFIEHLTKKDSYYIQYIITYLYRQSPSRAGPEGFCLPPPRTQHSEQAQMFIDIFSSPFIGLDLIQFTYQNRVIHYSLGLAHLAYFILDVILLRPFLGLLKISGYTIFYILFLIVVSDCFQLHSVCNNFEKVTSLQIVSKVKITIICQFFCKYLQHINIFSLP